MSEDESICALPQQDDARRWIESYIQRHIDWSVKTFGTGYRTAALTRHLEKEIEEIRRSPFDLEEWIDLIILALDGAWRCGKACDYTPEQIVEMLEKKQQKNFNRTWVLPADPSQPCEHERIEEVS